MGLVAENGNDAEGVEPGNHTTTTLSPACRFAMFPGGRERFGKGRHRMRDLSLAARAASFAEAFAERIPHPAPMPDGSTGCGPRGTRSRRPATMRVAGRSPAPRLPETYGTPMVSRRRVRHEVCRDLSPAALARQEPLGAHWRRQEHEVCPRLLLRRSRLPEAAMTPLLPDAPHAPRSLLRGVSVMASHSPEALPPFLTADETGTLLRTAAKGSTRWWNEANSRVSRGSGAAC